MSKLSALSNEAICGVIGVRLKTERLRQNLTQEQVARQANISLRTYKRFEGTGISSLPTLVAVLRVLNRLGMLEVSLPAAALLGPETIANKVDGVRKRATNRTSQWRDGKRLKA